MPLRPSEKLTANGENPTPRGHLLFLFAKSIHHKSGPTSSVTFILARASPFCANFRGRNGA